MFFGLYVFAAFRSALLLLPVPPASWCTARGSAFPACRLAVDVAAAGFVPGGVVVTADAVVVVVVVTVTLVTEFGHTYRSNY